MVLFNLLIVVSLEFELGGLLVASEGSGEDLAQTHPQLSGLLAEHKHVEGDCYETEDHLCLVHVL